MDANPFGDPKTMALLGLAQGLLAAGAPSALPTGLGGALSQGVGGALSGAMNAQKYNLASGQNQLLGLQNRQAQQALEGQNAFAASLPPDQRALFLSNPSAYIKSSTEYHPLSPGQTLTQGGRTVLTTQPNLVPVNAGGTTQLVNPQTGIPIASPIQHTLSPESQVITPAKAAELRIQASNADPLGTLGLSAIIQKAIAGAGTPNARPIAGNPTAAPTGGIPQDLHGVEFLGKLPKSTADQVKALAEGRMQFPAGFALKSPYWQNMISMVSQYDPNFDAVNFNARAATRKDFTSGKSADNMTALNTAIYHLGSLDKNLSALNNSSLPAYNTVKNVLGEQLGNASIQQAKKASEASAEAVSHELAKVFRSVGMSEGEVNAWKQKITTSSTPAQRKAIIGEALHLMEGRLEALGERYGRGMGTTADPLSLLDPKARAVYQQLKQSSGEASAPAGGIKFLGFE